jgi:hypothetical protein
MRVVKYLVILMALACVPLLSHAAELKITSSTQYLWYQDILTAQDQRDVAEYLRLNVTKLDKEGNINIYGYGRGSKLISSNEFGKDPEDYKGRLYYLYLDYRDAMKGFLDVRAGRTYISSAAVSGLVDGLYLNLKNIGPMGVTLFGGRDVRFQNKSEISTREDALAGASVYFDTVKNTHVELSFGRKYNENNIARENFGFDFSTTPLDWVNFYGNVKYDTIAEATNELLVGVKFNPLKSLILRGEYYQSYPTFDTDSIYSVFAVNQYKETSVKAEYAINDDYRISAGYAREDFDDDANANLYEVGLIAKPIKNLTLNVSYENRDGYAGQISGIRASGEYKLFNKAAIMAGVDYDDFKRQDSRQGYAKKYWGGFNVDVNKYVSAVVRVEDNLTYNYDNSYQGLVALNLKY